LAKAKAVLEAASALATKCPEWYATMQYVASMQGQDPSVIRSLTERGMAVEPDYYYYYHMQSLFLLPKCRGKTGDAEKYAQEVADKIGGKLGDAVYYKIAIRLVAEDAGGAGAAAQLGRMSWPRIQNGFAVLEEEYGPSLVDMNYLAYMAVQLEDAVVADKLFRRIGDRRSKEAWQIQAYFDRMKVWAREAAPLQARQRSQEDEAARNLQAAGGLLYKKAFDQSLATLTHDCLQRVENDGQRFELLIRVGETGNVEGSWLSVMTSVSSCVFGRLRPLPDVVVFPRPPHPSYLVRVDVDPSVVASAAQR
jgi:hypothetical protein